jgi:hypothetical protein
MRRLLVLACVMTLAPATAADGRWFAAETVDGPGAIERPVVDLAREGGGGLVYVKAGQAWLSRLQNGAWTTPVAIGGAGATEAVVAAGEHGRLVVAWVQGGVVYGAAAGAAPVALSGPGSSGLAIDLGVNGVAYVVWTQAGDVRAARLDAVWKPVPQPLDIDPAQAAGSGVSRARVAVAADGSAVVVWGESLPDGRTHVFARRIYDTTLSVLPRDASLAGPGAGPADSPEVDVEYDRSYAWVAFRQDLGGASRAIARRLRASTFQEAYALAPGAAAQPHLAMSSGGIGHGVGVTADGRLFGAPLRDDRFGPPVPADTVGGVSSAAVATSERSDSALIWRAGPEASAIVRGRIAPEEGRMRGVATLARGPVPAGPLSASSDRIGNVAVAIVQGAPGARSVGVAMHDLPPSRPALRSLRSVVGRRPLIRWRPGQEFVGRQRFRVLIDGRAVKTTGRTSYRARRLRRGRHRVRVVALDRRGQRSPASRRDTFRVR